MKNPNTTLRFTALLLSAVCLFAFTGCQKQPIQPNAPTGENADISSVVDSSFFSSQASESEAVFSMEEPPASSQEPSSTEKPPLSSKEPPFPSSQPVASGPSQPEAPTILFTIGERNMFWKNPDPIQASNVKIVIIRSMAELRNLFEQENGYDAPKSYGKYDDAFFTEHAIVFVWQRLSSCTMQRRINHLTRSGNQLIVDYSTLIPLLLDGGLMIWQQLLEVSKADLEGVTEATAQNHEIQLTEGEDYDESEWKQ